MRIENRTRVIVLLLLFAGTLGCQSPHYGQNRNRNDLALFGGLAGAGIGAALSKGNSNTGENALLGAAVGALSGAVVGDHMDEVEARNQTLFQQHLGRQLAGATTIEDVIALSQAGLGDDVIRAHLVRHGIARPLSTQDLILLKQQGVSDGVIQAMQVPPRPAVTSTLHTPVIVEEHYHAGPPFPYFYHRHYPRRRCFGPRPGFSWGVSFSN